MLMKKHMWSSEFVKHAYGGLEREMRKLEGYSIVRRISYDALYSANP